MTGGAIKTTPVAERGEWTDGADCYGHPPMWWELTGEVGQKAMNDIAIKICGTCPVQLQCAAYTRPEDVGLIRAGFALHKRSEAVAIARAAREAGPVATPDLPRLRIHPCGTYAAYRRHLARAERPCEPCRLAANTYHRVRWSDRHPGARPRGARS